MRHHLLSLRLWLGVVIAAAVALHLPAPARACSGLFDDDLKGEPTVPANGGLVTRQWCGISVSCVPRDLVLKRANGEAVPGRFVIGGKPRDATYVFVPNAPLVPGETLSFEDKRNFKSLMIQVSEPVPIVLADMAPTFEVQTEPVPEVIRRACCTERMDSCGRLLCVDIRAPEDTIAAWLTVAVPYKPEKQWHPVQLRFEWTLDGIDQPASDWGGGYVRVPIPQPTQEICIKPALRSVLDESVHTFAETCIPYGNHPGPGAKVASTYSISPRQVAECPRPLQNLSTEFWCESNRDLCRQEPGSPYCQRFAEFCALPDAAAVTPPDAGAPAPIDAAPTPEPDPDDDPKPASNNASGGCNVSARPPSPALLPLLFLLMRLAPKRRRALPRR